jgi:hypothetical protein
MQASPVELGDVVRRFAPAFLTAQGERLLPSQRKALSDIAGCRTAAMGGHRYRCEDCGQRFWVYHGCRNRSCPACHGRQIRQWLALRRVQVLPCPHYHLVATVPASMRALFLSDQKTLYGLFMKTVAQSILQLLGEPRFLGATPAMLMVLHTWTNDLHYHPHVHVLISAGGVTGDGKHWQWPKHKRFLLPVKALSALIRKRMGALIKKRYPQHDATLPKTTWTQGWNTFCKPCGPNPEAVLNYLARYVHRIALTNARIQTMDDTHVQLRVKNRRTGQWRGMRLPGEEFLRRFVMHILPRGFHKVRYYGLWHHNKRAQRDHARLLLAVHTKPHSPDPTASRADSHDVPLPPDFAEVFTPTCPHCNSQRIALVQHLLRNRSP